VARFELRSSIERPGVRRGSIALLGEVGAGGVAYGRLAGVASAALPWAGGELGGRLLVGAGTAELPNHRSLVFGGSGSLPGEGFRAYGGRRVVVGSAELLYPVPGPSLRLGAFGRTAPRLWIGPVLGAGAAGGEMPGMPWQPSAGFRPAIGVAVEAFDRMLRLEMGQGLRAGGGFTLSFDVSRAWWPIL
ncbi:MAG: hypothetical protein ACYC2K_08170, partial [Gemmatimonadales bacterium]